MQANRRQPPTRRSDGLDEFRAVLDENLGSLDDIEGFDDNDIRDRDQRLALIAQRVTRIVHLILTGMNRDFERCGKASCARARRCRGFACEPLLAPPPLASSDTARHHARRCDSGGRA
jgi:hypothetical protein